MLYSSYYNELSIFYNKNNIYTTIQLAMFAGVLLNYNNLCRQPVIMAICLCFVILFTLLQTLILIRGYVVNNALVDVIRKFEKEHNVTFLNDFDSAIIKRKHFTKKNLPSYFSVISSFLFLFVWITLSIIFIKDDIMCGIHIMVSFFKEEPTSSYFSIIQYFCCAFFSVIFPLTAKISDMIDEHGLVLHKYSGYIFSIFCGLSGGILVYMNNNIANALFAMMIGYVIRKRIDRANHIISFIIIVFSFIIFGSILKITLITFIVLFTILGLLKDLKYYNIDSKLNEVLKKAFLYIPIIYAIPGLIYSLKSGDWNVFICLFLFDFTYNAVRLISMKKEWYIP